MNDTKWEAVDAANLSPGEKVRLTHENGNVIHGEVYKDGKYIEADAVGHWAIRFQKDGYRFERAVPARILPTASGIYVSAWELPNAVPSDVKFYACQQGRWATGGKYVDESELPDDLVYIATASEVEEAEKRGIRKAHDALDSLDQRSYAPHHLRETFPDAFAANPKEHTA